MHFDQQLGPTRLGHGQRSNLNWPGHTLSQSWEQKFVFCTFHVNLEDNVFALVSQRSSKVQQGPSLWARVGSVQTRIWGANSPIMKRDIEFCGLLLPRSESFLISSSVIECVNVTLWETPSHCSLKFEVTITPNGINAAVLFGRNTTHPLPTIVNGTPSSKINTLRFRQVNIKHSLRNWKFSAWPPQAGI
mmetsp:Transcript_64635/g.140784  ORF Transcript_64635/g.140784 Transcript_64635/m.140784 type:complete len:190 (+) Transcript_64635:1082-1651(+)